MTTDQVRRSFAALAAAVKTGADDVLIEKDVTRRMGWLFLMVGMVLMACEKCQGLGKGGKIVQLGGIRVTSVRRERLNRMTIEPDYGAEEVRREGFPKMTPAEFVAFFCKGHGCVPSDMVTRIEFEYLV